MNSKKRIRLVLMLTAAVTVFSVFSVFSTYRGHSEDRGIPTFLQSGVRMALASVTQYSTMDGQTRWKLDAASARLIDSENAAVFARPAVRFFSEQQGEIRVNAKEGQVQTGSNDIRVSGDVVMEGADFRLETPSLEYRHDRKEFVTPESVRISGAGILITADSGAVDIQGRKAEFIGHVKGFFGAGPE